ncbi:MAG: T9SS type A sorting domain-containing protein [Bacteroidales bacterium]|nr:T9SS type A sorting domain-containing protein [Bacteroidales bacterium]
MKQIFCILFLSLANISFAQEYPTIGEIYDYDIGDIFHISEIYEYGESGIQYIESTYKNIEVLDKYYSLNEDTVYYDLFIKKQEIYGEDSSYMYYVEYYPTIWISDLEAIKSGDTLIENPDLYNGRKTVQTSGEYISGPDEDSWSDTWTVGCGNTYHYHNSWSWGSMQSHIHTDQLVYYKKGEEEWGEEQIIVGIQEISNRSDIKIYPNPVSNQLNVSIADNFGEFKRIYIYNANGKLVISNPISSSNMIVDVSSLINGIYFVNLIDENGIIKGKQKFLKVF